MPHQLGYQVRWDPALVQSDRESPPQIVDAGNFHPSAGSGVPLIDSDIRCLADLQVLELGPLLEVYQPWVGDLGNSKVERLQLT